MTVRSIKKEALDTLSGNWGNAVLTVFVYYIITFLLSSLITMPLAIYFSGGFNEWVNSDTDPIIVNIADLILQLLFVPLSIGFSWFFLSLERAERADVGYIFRLYGKPAFSLKLIGVSIMYFLFVFLWLLLLIIPGIIKGISYSQAFLLLKDNPEYGVLEAITESKKRMKGYKGKYFLLLLSFIGWFILSIFTLFIGLLWLIPYINTSIAVFYNEEIVKDHYEPTVI